MSWSDKQLEQKVNEAFNGGYTCGYADALVGAYRVGGQQMSFEEFDTEVKKELKRLEYEQG